MNYICSVLNYLTALYRFLEHDQIWILWFVAGTMFLGRALYERKHNKNTPGKTDKEIPNAETGEAISEVEEMKKHPDLGKTYTNVDEMMKDSLNKQEEKL